MSRPPDYSVNEILQAGQRINASGAPVNGRAIWKALGCRGRPGRYQQIWDEHNPSPAVTTDQSDVRLPDAVQAIVDRDGLVVSKAYGKLAMEIFKASEAAANSRLLEETQAARAMRAKYEADIAETDALLEQAGESQAELRETIERLEASQAALSWQLGVAEGKVAEQACRIAELSQLLSDERALRTKSVQALICNLPDEQQIRVRARKLLPKRRECAADGTTESSQP